MTGKQALALVTTLTLIINLTLGYFGLPGQINCTIAAAQEWVDDAFYYTP